MQDYEKLGVFYLGAEYDLAQRQLKKDDLLLYDSKDLLTHAVCVGMTGSGKTGLCLDLLEEAAIDNIPALVIDPKGDLPNLLLTFPELTGAEFLPWINEEEARRKGMKPSEFAEQQAQMWKKGLADWHQDAGRIQRLREAADFAIYTPGSNSGLPISILKSFEAPPNEILQDGELFRERISTAATGLLSLLGINADPLQSREHILLATILQTAWKKGENLDLGKLIQNIQQPPVSRIGVLELESFYPAKERFALAMQMNNLLASPGFEAWLEGAPLDIDALLYTPEGKPRVTIFYIAHLGETERMFFVTLLLNQVLGWMRSKPGTTSLRALLYMDEIFGYFPPVANPPSKQPLLTLLKQARAYGLGIVLATQNPADLDYKGLANTGTWLIGRLQTERDKARLLDGLEGAAVSNSGAFDRAGMDKILAGLGARVFLMHNVHEDHPVVFQSRWALSYLRGPMTRQQVKQLMDPHRARLSEPVSAKPTESPTEISSPHLSVATPITPRPLLPPEIPQFFLPIRGDKPEKANLLYRPGVVGFAQVYFQDAKLGVDETGDLAFFLPLDGGGNLRTVWDNATSLQLTEDELKKEPNDAGAGFSELPPDASKAKNYDVWKKTFAEFLFRGHSLSLWKSPSLGIVSKVGESERNFRLRLQQAAREERDLQAEKLRQKYAPKLATLEDKIRKGQITVEKEGAQATQSKVSTALSFGTTILGAFLGRKTVSVSNMNKAATAARGVGRTMKDSKEVAFAQQNLDALIKQKQALEEQFQEDVQGLETQLNPQTEELEELTVKPKKTNVSVRLVALGWSPCWMQAEGQVQDAG